MTLTQRLVQAGDLLGIKVLDHIIVGDGAYISFADRGLISTNQEGG
jgi:DNA repair protein RadC